ncbi:MAG: MFS transporter [Actinomycetota bacterium]|nr:MFS transporter [Actinomycetota bacterium]
MKESRGVATSSGVGALTPYVDVLRTPYALRMVLFGFIGRLPLSMVGLGSVLLVEDYTGSYGLGGGVAATGAVTTALLGPLIGRLADCLGQRRVLLPVVAVHIVGGLVFLFAVRSQTDAQPWPLWVMFVAAGVAGAALPPISSMIRTRWSYLLKGSPRLQIALAFESVTDELVFIIGPVLVTFLSTTGHTTSGIVTAFVLAVVGSLLFAAQFHTEPPPTGLHLRHGPLAIRTPGLWVLCPVGLALGAILGVLEVSLVAFADEVNRKAYAGLLIAALAVGSMLSGVLWGLVHWHNELRRRLVYSLAVLAVGTIPLLLVSNLWLMMIFVFIAGTAVSPSLIGAFTLTERLVPSAVVTEGFTWLGTSVGLGVALGAGMSGKLVDLSGANTAFSVATVAAGAAALVVLVGQKQLDEGPVVRSVAIDTPAV